MPAPDAILQLVDRFHQHSEVYRAGHYNETQVRQEFIDPLFVALGWDVTNQKGRAPDRKDVILEDEVKVGGIAKAPDYGFYLDSQRKFFVEAKRPSVVLKSDNKLTFAPAFQLRRYAWNARLPLSILTTFAEMAVYDGRVKPDPTDRAPVARVKYYEYTQYADCWDEITELFAREAVEGGALEKYAETKPSKLKNVIPVDDAFLDEMEHWRELLAKNIVQMNDNMTPLTLNYAVQMTIDRIVFLRICEDRGIEVPGRLLGTQNGGKVYERLCHLFRDADARYNSGLFHFGTEKDRNEQPDQWTPGLHIDDEPLREIILRLCKESIYDFSQIPVEVLGHVYERFLGQVVEFSGKRKVAVIEKPEVRKAGGVYYTPTYIVEYSPPYRRRAARRQDAHPSRQAAHRRSGLRIGIVLAGRVPISAGLAPRLVRRGWGGQAHGCDLRGRGRRLEADDRRTQAHFARQPVRRGHRCAGRRSDQALAAAARARRRIGAKYHAPVGDVQTARPARPGRQHQMRQLADRL